MKKKDTLIIYRDTHEAIKSLEPEIQVELYNAMFDYMDGIEVSLSPMGKVIFNFIKGRIDYDVAKFIKKCEMNKVNGEKGGRPTKPQT